MAICAIGVIACIIWLLIAKRSEAFYDHWYEQLKYLEREYLVPIRTFQIAAEFFARGHITLGKESFKLDPLARVMRMFMAMQFLATTFSIVWFCLGLYLLFLS